MRLILFYTNEHINSGKYNYRLFVVKVFIGIHSTPLHFDNLLHVQLMKT